MNNQRGSGGHKWALLLIPTALIIAKGARHRGAMWEAGSGPSGASGYGHRHRGRFGGGADRLPPRIEAMLESWHTRAHQAADTAETTTI